MERLAVIMSRLIPALVMAAGVTLLTAGLLSYSPSALQERATAETGIAGDPLFAGPTLAPEQTPVSGGQTPATGRQTPAPGATPSPTPSRSVLDIASPPTTSIPEPDAESGVATRIRVPALQIDLPVVSGDLVVPNNPGNYPLCDVAMFLPTFVQPGEPGTTYLYAHAQRGMFLPLLRASEVDDGASLLGALVEVYTSADELHIYEITRVKRHATDLSLATDAEGLEQLILQTSEGPTGTLPKLQVAATPVSVIRASAAEAQPNPRPRPCGPGS
jgi:hypothetical protein